MRARSGRKSALQSGSRPPSLAEASPSVRCVNAYWAGTEIVVLVRDEGGRLQRTSLPVDHASFVRKIDLRDDLLRQLRSSRHVRGISDEGDWIRISWWTRGDCLRAADLNGWFSQQNVDVFEADVDPVRRWMIDNAVELQRPRRVYLDIETDSRVPFSQKHRARTLCWSLIAHDSDEEWSGVLEEDTDDAERDLLEELWKVLTKFDQVVAWNGDPFDFPQIADRSARVGLTVETRRWLWLDHLPIFKRLNAHAAESGEEKQSMALGAVAAAVLGPEVKKLLDLRAIGGESTWALWVAGGEKRHLLVEYNLEDSRLMKRVEERTGYLSLHQTVCELTCTLPDTRGGNPTRYVEGFLMRLGKERGMHFPTWHAPREAEEGEEERGQYRGAFVLEPTKIGIVRDVHVADFSRLYPSVILSWNMGPETYRPDIRLQESDMARPSYLAHIPLKRFPIPEGHCSSADDVVFAHEPQSVLALAVEEILRLRAGWDEKAKSHPKGTREHDEAERRSQALKILVNAMYGVVGSRYSRFYVPEIAQAITQTGVWVQKQTLEAAATRGMKALYGDTDSTFIMGTSRTAFETFVTWCNAELYPKLWREKGVPDSRARIKLAYEKAFSMIVMVGKKRYAARIAHFKGREPETPQIEIKGLEYKRGDSIRLALRMQREMLELLLVNGCVEVPAFEELVMRWRTRVLEEPLDLADVMQSKGLGKGLREYAREARQPHVEVAVLLAQRGREVRQGVRIEFFVTDGSSQPTKYSPAEDWKGECDRFYVWEKQVYPPTQRVLEAAFPAGQWRKYERARPPKAKRADKMTGLLFEERAKARDVGQDGSKPVGTRVPTASTSRQIKLFG